MNPSDGSSTFWSAVSQIIPVLGLALVIEIRVIGRRWTRKPKSMPKPGIRVPALLGLALTGAALFMQEMLALGLLIDDTGDAPWWRFLALGVVGLGMLMVVGLPIVNIAAVGSSDLRYSRRNMARMAKRMRRFELRLLEHRNDQIGNVLKTRTAINEVKNLLAKETANPHFNEAPFQTIIEGMEGNRAVFKSTYDSLVITSRNLAGVQEIMAKGPTADGRKRVLKRARRLLREFID